MIRGAKLAGIEYAGVEGISRPCQEAVMRLVQFRDDITVARILSASRTHCFLLTVNDQYVAIKSGFSSGYGGEGPRSFSYVLRLLDLLKAEIDEYEVDDALIERLDSSALTVGDINAI